MRPVQVQTLLSDDDREILGQLGKHAGEARKRGYKQVEGEERKKEIKEFLEECEPIVLKMLEGAGNDCAELGEVVNVMRDMLYVGTPLRKEGQELALKIIGKLKEPQMSEKPGMRQMLMQMYEGIQKSSGNGEGKVDDEAKAARMNIVKQIAEDAKTAIDRETPEAKKGLWDEWLEKKNKDIEGDSKDPEHIEAAKRLEEAQEADKRAKLHAKEAGERANEAGKELEKAANLVSAFEETQSITKVAVAALKESEKASPALDATK